MRDYPQLKLDLEDWLDQLRETVAQLADGRFIDPGQISRWREHLGHARKSLQDVPLQIAVVGAVKSGKSTLINALVARDLLKRGAGITSSSSWVIRRPRRNEDAWKLAVKEPLGSGSPKPVTRPFRRP